MKTSAFVPSTPKHDEDDGGKSFSTVALVTSLSSYAADVRHVHVV